MLASLFNRARSREALRLAAHAKVSLDNLEAHLKLHGDKRSLVLARAFHADLAAAVAETGRIMGVDVSPLSGGTPKELP